MTPDELRALLGVAVQVGHACEKLAAPEPMETPVVDTVCDLTPRVHPDALGPHTKQAIHAAFLAAYKEGSNGEA